MGARATNAPSTAVGIHAVQSAMLLLGAMLLYDGFFVFVQPLLTRSSSVMVEVRRLPSVRSVESRPS